jgi:hypothetical protein
VNWEAIAAASEFVGVIAVVISLVYVAHEVRSNTKALQASAGFDSTQGMALLNEGLVHAVLGDAKYQQGAESRFLQVIAKVYDPEGSIKEMTLSDQAVVGLLSRAVFQRIEGEFYLYEHGFLDPSHWESRSAWARGFLALPIPKAWWEGESKQGVYRPSFVEALDAGEKTSLKLPGWLDAAAGGSRRPD